jgi:hypothetical protein
MTYTTTELLAILAAEKQACISGKRLNLKATVPGVNPLIDQFLNLEGVQKFSAYQDFRAAVHHYQLEEQVSGILWKQISYQSKTLTYPQIDEELIALPSDLTVLAEAKASIYNFWQQISLGMDIYQAVQRGHDYQPIEAPLLERSLKQADWASIDIHSYPNFVQIILQLGWGQPHEARYHHSWPKAGCEFIYALPRGYRPMPCSN